MANKTYYWLRLKNDFFKSKELKKLRKIAGGDTYTIIYLKMQLASLQNEGILYYEGVEDSFTEELALDIDEDSENVKVTVAFLMRCGLLVQDSESEFSMPETKECIGRETQGAARVRRYRDKKKALQCNMAVTNGNTEKEIEKEIEIEIEKKEDISLSASPSSLPPVVNEIKLAFENAFHPLFKAADLETLEAYTEDYGRKGVLAAIESASKRKNLNRSMLSPRYLLPILQNPAQTKTPELINNSSDIPLLTETAEEQIEQMRREDREREAKMKELGEDDPYNVYGESKK